MEVQVEHGCLALPAPALAVARLTSYVRELEQQIQLLQHERVRDRQEIVRLETVRKRQACVPSLLAKQKAIYQLST